MDPIEGLIQNTRDGFYSGIEYRKVAERDTTERVIFPKTMLVEPGGRLRVRAIQVRPASGIRTFCREGILRVWRVESPVVPEAMKVNNTFVTGEAFETARVDYKKVRAMSAESGKNQRAAKPAWLEQWFRSYEAVVTDAILDMKVSDTERRQVQNAQVQLGLTDEQIRAVHAHVFAQHLISATADGEFTDGDFDAMGQLNECLRVLGAAPGG